MRRLCVVCVCGVVLMAHVALRQAPEDRLRRLLAQSLGEEQASNLLSQFGGGPEPLTLPELARRIGNREGDANRLRFRPQNRPAADFAAGANILERSGLSFSSSLAPGAGSIIQPRGPEPLSGMRPVGAPDAAQEAAPGAGRPPDPRSESLLRAAAVTTAQAQARAAQNAARSPLEIAQQQESAADFRARSGGIDVDTVSAVGPIQPRTFRSSPRTRIEEGGSVAIRRDAERAAGANFGLAQTARQADLQTGFGAAEGVSPGLQTALVNERRDAARFSAQADRQRIDQEFRQEIETLKQFGLSDRQANQIASQNAQTKVRALGTFTQNQQRAVVSGQEGGFAGFGEQVNPDIQSALDAERAGIGALDGTGAVDAGGDAQVRASLAAEGFTPEQIETILADPESRAELGLP